MEWIFLGTSCMVPTKDRNVAGYFLRYKNHGLLFDCGEGTQRQMNIVGIKRTAITKIFITHWHGDHVSGLSGLLQTLSSSDVETIELYGPKDTKKRITALKAAFFSETEKININVHEVNPKKISRIVDSDEFEIWAAPMKHTLPTIGFRFVEKDKANVNMSKLKRQGIPPGPHIKPLTKLKDSLYAGKKILAEEFVKVTKGKIIGYVTDTRPCRGALEVAKDADLLIMESTYLSKHLEKAEKFHHMTSEEAATIASEADAKELYLIHFSQRYKEPSEILQEAKTIFNNTKCAYDFLKLRL